MNNHQQMDRNIYETYVKEPDNFSAVSGALFSGRIIRASVFNNFVSKRSGQACKKSLVGVTTTLYPTRKCVQNAAQYMQVIIVGDYAPPGSNEEINETLSQNTTFFSYEDQMRLYPELARIIPTQSFARKNLGFVYAINELGACQVWDFDDDNCLGEYTQGILSSSIESQTPQIWLTSRQPVVNPYLLFGSPEFIWPRGFPLEQLSEREFPRITPPAKEQEIQVDVIQALQDYDPDVDALWRLKHAGTHLPMDWKMSQTLQSALVGIHPARTTPFNAQATLLSRRALEVAFLPCTVHGRVSDIWRSYIMQYLLRHLRPKMGIVAFSGATVVHRRTKHNYMADMNAETQLYERSGALVAYLDSRPMSEEGVTVCTEYVRLMDDLYTRGFVEIADVKAAAVWVDLACGNEDSEHLVSQSMRPPNETRKNNAVAVLHVNFMHVEAVTLWMGLHRHQFHSVAVYVPGLQPCMPISGITIHCLSNDSPGYLAYESIVHAMTQELPSWETVSGFLFLHDDVLWKPALEIDTPISRALGACEGGTGYHECYTEFKSPVKDEWMWTKTDVGQRAETDFQALLAQDQSFSAQEIRPFFGQSDFFFVSKSDTALFLHYSRMMLSTRLFLEIAIPSLFLNVLRNTSTPFILVTNWGEQRKNPHYMETIFRQSLADLVHPVKLNSIDSIQVHLNVLYGLT